jgi:AraC-like DNA-binding protein
VSNLKYHESIQRGSLSFPLDYYFVDCNHSRYEMPYHWHDEVEIIHILKGSFRLSVGGETHTLWAGDAAYIASGLLHGGEPEGCEYECVVLDLRLLMRSDDLGRRYIGDLMDGHAAVAPRFAAESALVRQTLLPMFDALRRRYEGYTLITLGCLYRFAGEIYRQKAYTFCEQPDGAENRRMLKLKKVFEMIEGHYTEPLHLAQLAASVGLTPKYLCRFFKEATHRTPVDYIAYYRVEMACYALAATERNVTEIALDTGFADLNYFIRCFKKYKGVTPGNYRKMLRAQPKTGES